VYRRSAEGGICTLDVREAFSPLRNPP